MTRVVLIEMCTRCDLRGRSTYCMCSRRSRSRGSRLRSRNWIKFDDGCKPRRTTMRNGIRPKTLAVATRAARKVEAGSGNVFVDLRVPNPGEAQAKAKLGGRICELLAAKRLSRPTDLES